jgi:hypothetical protein
MASESTSDFAYCVAIINYQLRYAESREVQPEYDYPHGAPIALFTMLWIEGYINHLIEVLFPQHYVSRSAREKFEYRKGTKGKFEYLMRNSGLDFVWPIEFDQLVNFRNRICHARVVNRALKDTECFPPTPSFVDSFQLSMGTMAQVKTRHAFSANFLEQLHDSIYSMGANERKKLATLVVQGKSEYKLESIDLDPLPPPSTAELERVTKLIAESQFTRLSTILHPVHSPLAQQDGAPNFTSNLF